MDFTPYAANYLKQLIALKEEIEHSASPSNEVLHRIINAVMQLKSNGSMFHYQLLSMVSDVMLRFLEKTLRIDSDLVEILSVYINVLQIIINKRLLGNGGNEGYALTQELHNACLRYYKKHNIS